MSIVALIFMQTLPRDAQVASSKARCILALTCMLALAIPMASASEPARFPTIEEALKAARGELGNLGSAPGPTPAPAPAKPPGATGTVRGPTSEPMRPAARSTPVGPPTATREPPVSDPIAQGARLNALLKQYGSKQEVPATLLYGKLFVAISFSMPDQVLKSLLMQAKAAGATVIVRGLSGSLKGTQERIARLMPSRTASKNPIGSQQAGAFSIRTSARSFERFGISEVPAFVLVPPRGAREDCQTSGCPSYGEFVMATGDVSVAYAMDAIRRVRPDLGAAAEFFAKRALTATAGRQ